MSLSREVAHYERLKRTMGAYLLVMGKPRQEDLVKYVAAAGNGAASVDADWLASDLATYTAFGGDDVPPGQQ